MNIEQLVRDVTWGAAEKAAPPGDNRKWSWAPGVSLWVNPEVRCPWCDAGVETGRVWAVDERRKKVMRVWMMDGRELRDAREWHPHVFAHSRQVCLGDADDVAQALWMGLQPGDRANGAIDVREWLEGMGHKCEGRTLTYDPEPEDEHEGEQLCERCETWTHEDYGSWCGISDQWYCDDCWVETHTTCDGCSESVYTGSGRWPGVMYEVQNGEEICQECYEADYFTCDNCSKVTHDNDMVEGPEEGDNWCRACRDAERVDCTWCGEEGWKDKMEEGLCEGCAQLDVCEECDARVEELMCREPDGPQVCRRCFYGETGLVGELPFEEGAQI